MIRLSIVTSIALSALFAPAFALDGSYSILTSTSTGLAVGMNLYLPPGYDHPLNAGRQYPLMIFFGGAGERGDPTDADAVLQESTVWGPAKEIRYADRDFPFIIVTPISTKFYSSLPAEYNTMIEYLKSIKRVDADRIFFTGGSAGADGVLEFAQSFPKQLAAIVPAGCQILPRTPERLREIPTWLFHGFADAAVSRKGTVAWADAIANSFGSSPVSCEKNYPYGTASDGSQTYNPDNQTGSFRPGSGWTWTSYTRSSADSLLLLTLMSTDLHNVWHYAVTNNIVLHWMAKQRRQSAFGGTPPSLPGRVQAEAFDFGGHQRAYYDTTIANSGGSTLRNTANPYDGTTDYEQVDLALGGDNTVMTDTTAGEWVEYTVNASSGNYILRLRLSAAVAGGSLRLLNADGSVLAGPIAVPASTGFVTVVVPGVQLLPGIQTLRLAIDQGGFALDWFEIENISGAADVIVDNRQTDKVLIVGPWVVASYTSGFYGLDYLSAAPGATASAAFRPTLPRSSSYQVFIQFPSTAAYGVARVTIDRGDGSAANIVLVDQRTGGGSWQPLGTFTLPAGTQASVTIAAVGSPGYISADAVRFWEIDPGNTVPNVFLTAPNDSSSTTTGVVLALTATASDPDIHSTTPGLQKVEFYADDGSTSALVGVATNGSGDPASYSVNYSPTMPGVYALTAIAYDFSGGVATSPSHSLNVSAPPAGVLSFSSSHYSVNEGDGTVTITMQRDGGSAGTVSVDYTTVAGSASSADFSDTTGTLTWADGDMSLKSFTIAIIQDTAVEGDESLTLSLSRPTNDANIGGASILTIADDDVPPDGVLQFSLANYYQVESNAGSSTVIITVNSTGDMGGSSVTWTSSDDTATAGSDYVAGTGTLTFLPGETSKNFTITTFGDTAQEFDETVRLTLSNPTRGAVLGTQATASLVIVDDDNSGNGPPRTPSTGKNSGSCGIGSGLAVLLAAIALTVANFALRTRNLP